MAIELLGPRPATGAVIHDFFPVIERSAVGPGLGDELKLFIAQRRQCHGHVRRTDTASHGSDCQHQACRCYLAIDAAQAIQLDLNVVAEVTLELCRQRHDSACSHSGNRQVSGGVDAGRQAGGHCLCRRRGNHGRAHTLASHVQVDQARRCHVARYGNAAGRSSAGVDLQRQAPDLTGNVDSAVLLVHCGQHRAGAADGNGFRGARHQHQATDFGGIGVVVDLANDQAAKTGTGAAVRHRVINLGIEQRDTNIRRNVAETDAHTLASFLGLASTTSPAFRRRTQYALRGT